MLGKMSGQQIVLLVVALMVLALGAYMTFLEGQVTGVVLMGLATTLSALSAVIGAQEKKNEETGDAG